MRKVTSAVAAGLLVAAFTLSATLPASATTSNLGARSCNGGAHNGITSITKGATSHNVWTSVNNNQGTSWPGDSTWRSRSFISTKTSSSANYVTYTSQYAISTTCTVPI